MRITFDFDSDELNYRDAAKAIKQTLKRYRQLIATDHSGNLLPEDSGNIWLDDAKIGTFVVSEPDENEELTRLKDAIVAHDNKRGDRANGGKDAQPPDGDDYNTLWSEVSNTLVTLGIMTKEERGF
jgi:hypothetical protein